MLILFAWVVCGVLYLATVFGRIGKPQLDEMIEQSVGNMSKASAYIVITAVILVLGPFNWLGFRGDE